MSTQLPSPNPLVPCLAVLKHLLDAAHSLDGFSNERGMRRLDWPAPLLKDLSTIVMGEGQNLKSHDPVYDNQKFSNLFLLDCVGAKW